MIRIFSHIAFFTVLIFVFPSCKQSPSGNEPVAHPALVADSGMAAGNNFIILSPSELMFDLQNIRLEKTPDLPEPLDVVPAYLASRKTAILLGFYVADLAFLVSQNKKHDAMKYLSSIKKLGDHLKISGIFTEDRLNSFQNNLENTDSLYMVIVETQYSLVNLLQTSNRNDILIVATWGGIVESLYILTTNINSNEEISATNELIENYQFMYTEFYNYCIQYSDNNLVKALFADIEQIHTIFSYGSLQKNNSQILTKQSGNNIYINQPENHQLSLEEITQLRAIVTKLRVKYLNE
ncbi:MAG: hypothetical protein JXB34_02535 [Bacteroidales bacterium]|nr:hypothetical protein [Bacteroidales bacterium]